MSLLKVEHIAKSFGGVKAINDVSFELPKGQLLALLGPNGAGKSTAMKAIFGMLNLREGRVEMDGEDISGLTPQARVQTGMGFVPQTSNIFTSLTVEENLKLNLLY